MSNQIMGRSCPAVICQRTGPAFKWQTADGIWHEGDELPRDIEVALPGYEWGRCIAHGWRRMGERRGAA
jgi:hypothetical protein